MAKKKKKKGFVTHTLSQMHFKLAGVLTEQEQKLIYTVYSAYRIDPNFCGCTANIAAQTLFRVLSPDVPKGANMRDYTVSLFTSILGKPLELRGKYANLHVPLLLRINCPVVDDDEDEESVVYTIPEVLLPYLTDIISAFTPAVDIPDTEEKIWSY